MQKVLITGNGQLANELLNARLSDVEVLHCPRATLDITSSENCKRIIEQLQPDWIINAAAYTAVDKAESDKDSAFLVNETGVRNLAQAALSVGARLIHVSTDFVFDGNACTPYKDDHPTSPVGVYGASKLAGEGAALAVLREAIIVRTSWVYSMHGNNFVKTMLKLMETKEQLGVIVEQVGSPTWAAGLARVLWLALEKDIAGGIYHWSDAGVCSWYDFAVAIQNIGFESGLLDKKVPVKPIPTSAYPTPAARPNYSVMDKSKIEDALGIEGAHWQAQLEQMLNQLKTEN